MRCPYCGKDEDHVVDSRPSQEGRVIRRRRECLACGRRYTTFERYEERPLMVVKKDGRREPFDREKVLRGMVIACRKRPVSMERLEQAVDEIEHEIQNRMESEISSTEIGRMVMEKLLAIDPVAYVRFASVYEEFNDPQQFNRLVQMLTRMQKRASASRQ
ncbi:MAG: transcriptional regulator NrdR [Armatimonadetes bacterium]|jgi:transcriptional repressor NrdR|nr:transcriptional regulator NrdR [Armatimonadota bacterium]CUU09519.1 transcriptional repressor NrdR [Armatimonadetes bacterium GBS]CUU35127.1 transcriptional repressor NrdR [Armatimonadetes bacterium GXS]CUU37182.1 transcriptional repressor NrdR [Armatimonadetes bacterium DC]GBC91124.1 Transcriptional repressor NrdR [bacterium HR14]GIV14052.1 MAG: transcriptional repressor NrdR [Fimbriimonadales bacterium]